MKNSKEKERARYVWMENTFYCDCKFKLTEELHRSSTLAKQEGIILRTAKDVCLWHIPHVGTKYRQFY